MDYIKLKLKDKSAQDMVEFAFVLPLLMFCFVMILTGGQLVYNKFVVYNACFNGVRQACTERSRYLGQQTFEEVVESYYPQMISIDKTKTQRNIKTNGLFTLWQKDAEIIGEVKLAVKTLFPVNFSDLKAPNLMYVNGTSAAYVEYDKSNGGYDTSGKHGVTDTTSDDD